VGPVAPSSGRTRRRRACRRGSTAERAGTPARDPGAEPAAAPLPPASSRKSPSIGTIQGLLRLLARGKSVAEERNLGRWRQRDVHPSPGWSVNSSPSRVENRSVPDSVTTSCGPARCASPQSDAADHSPTPTDWGAIGSRDAHRHRNRHGLSGRPVRGDDGSAAHRPVRPTRQPSQLAERVS
jgi:hypothetical protein